MPDPRITVQRQSDDFRPCLRCVKKGEGDLCSHLTGGDTNGHGGGSNGATVRGSAHPTFEPMVCGVIKGATDPARGSKLDRQVISHPGMDPLSPPGSMAATVAPLVYMQGSRHAGPGAGTAAGAGSCLSAAAAAGSADGCDQLERARNHQAPIAVDDTTGDVGSKVVEACASASRSLSSGENLSTRHRATGGSFAAQAAAAAVGEAGGIAASEGSSDLRVATSLVGAPTAGSQTSTRGREDEADVYDAPHCICSGAPVLPH
jgi:hypothetical protein